MYMLQSISQTALGGSIPLRLLDCFRLVTPVVSDAFGAFLGAGCGGRAIFWMAVGTFGPGSGEFRAKEGEGERVTVSAICRDMGLRYHVKAPAWRGSAATGSAGLRAGWARRKLKRGDGCGELVAI
jgi:hypothetical protein